MFREEAIKAYELDDIKHTIEYNKHINSFIQIVILKFYENVGMAPDIKINETSETVIRFTVDYDVEFYARQKILPYAIEDIPVTTIDLFYTTKCTVCEGWVDFYLGELPVIDLLSKVGEMLKKSQTDINGKCKTCRANKCGQT